jgi:3-(3-hydroxy-phenyl)propionate hydroxylase
LSDPARAPFDVAIVGYGPVGATLANLCGVHGLRAVVLEASTAPYPLPRACHLDAEIMRVFQGVGLADGMARVCERSPGMEYVAPDHSRVFTYEDFERAPILGWHEDYVFVQPELDAVLRRGVERFAGQVDVRLGSEVVGVLDGRSVATVRTADGDRVEARWVVACDGASSAVRRMLKVRNVDLGYDEEWLVVDVMLHDRAGPPGRIQQFCDPARLATYVPSAHGHRRFEFQVLPTDDPVALAGPHYAWALAAPWHKPTEGELVRSAVYRFHAVVAAQWRLGRVFLAGDAAHQMPPFMGQGMCSGIRDVANLAWKLALVRDGHAGDALLDSYEEERRPHVVRTVELSVAAGRLLHEIASAYARGAPPALPPPDVDDDERWSRLPPLGAGPFPVGHQARQPTVRWREGRGDLLRLDDVLGPEFALLTATKAAVDAPPFVRVVDTSALVDVQDGVARLLAGRAAVLVRPDRYVVSVGDDPQALVDDLSRALRPPAGA